MSCTTGVYRHSLTLWCHIAIVGALRSHLAVFVILSDGRARLDFIQNMEYKFVELLSATFVRSSDEVVRQQITYRYNAMKVRRGPTEGTVPRHLPRHRWCCTLQAWERVRFDVQLAHSRPLSR